MIFTFTVEAEAERSEGKFASRSDVAAVLADAIEEANPGSVEAGEDGTTYEVESWSVTTETSESDAKRATASIKKEYKALKQERAEVGKLIAAGGLGSVWFVLDKEVVTQDEAGEVTMLKDSTGFAGIYRTEAEARAEVRRANHSTHEYVATEWELEGTQAAPAAEPEVVEAAEAVTSAVTEPVESVESVVQFDVFELVDRNTLKVVGEQAIKVVDKTGGEHSDLRSEVMRAAKAAKAASVTPPVTEEVAVKVVKADDALAELAAYRERFGPLTDTQPVTPVVLCKCGCGQTVPQPKPVVKEYVDSSHRVRAHRAAHKG